jgi:hypothetical protein
VVLDDEARAVVAAALFVAEQAQDDVSGRRCGGLGRLQEGGEHHRHAALHVERAASPDVAVGHLSAERWPQPAPLRWDDVDMALHQEPRRAALASKSRDQVRPLRVLRNDLDLAAGSLEELPGPLNARALAARRV